MGTARFTTVLGIGLASALALAGCSAPAEQPESGKPEVAAAAELPNDLRKPTGEFGALADLLPAEAAEKGTWVAAGSGSVAPLQFMPVGGGEIIGIVADLTAEYAWRLGLDLTIEQVSGAAVMPGVESGRYDAAIAAGDFKERQATTTFVDILRGGTTFLGSAINPTDITGVEDLCGHSVAIAKSSIQQTRAEEQNEICIAAGDEEIDIQAYDDLHASVLAVQSQQAEVSWTDISPANVIMSESPGMFEIVGELMWYAPYGVGINATRPDVAVAVQGALQSMVDDGTYTEILARWGSENLGMDAIEINGSEF